MFDTSYVSTQIDVSQTRLHVRVRRNPEKPTLLLLHGYPQTHVMWHKLASRLESEFALVIPDLRVTVIRAALRRSRTRRTSPSGQWRGIWPN